MKNDFTLTCFIILIAVSCVMLNRSLNSLIEINKKILEYKQPEALRIIDETEILKEKL